MLNSYKPRFQETTAAENPARARATNTAGKKDKKYDQVKEYLTKRGIKVSDVFLKDSTGELVIRIQGGGSQYNDEIRKAVKSFDLDEQFDLNKIEKYLVDQTDDYQYFVAAKKEPQKTVFNKYVSRDEKI